MERIVLYPVCLVLSRFHEYETASRWVLKKLGIEVLDVEDFCCCGSLLVPGVRDGWINLPAYSLARAGEFGDGHHYPVRKLYEYLFEGEPPSRKGTSSLGKGQ